MTTKQIKYILELKGFEPDKWTTLDNGTNGIGVIALFGDNNLLVSPGTTQFYFDTDEEMLYVKKYGGKPKLEMDDIYCIPVKINEQTYYFAPRTEQFLDNTLGHFSDCFSFANICAIYDKKHSVYNIY